jgi:hypothetical protein
VFQSNPEAWLVMIEVGYDTIDEGLAWAAAQPWIDIVSVSLGNTANIPANPPDPAFNEFTYESAIAGKIVVFGAGNDPTLTINDNYDGPPWVISVGGARNTTKGWTALSSFVPDVASNYASRGPVDDDITGDETDGGTSIAAPIVAGTLSRVVLDARQSVHYAGGIEDGLIVPPLGIAAGDVRNALNASAIYWAPTDYDAAAGIENPVTTAIFASTPLAPAVGPAGPWVQFGWGYVNASFAPLITDVLLGKVPAPEKPAEAKQFMETYQRAREARWPPPSS